MSITNRITGDQKISGFVNIYNQNNENIENALKEYKDDYKKLDSEIRGKLDNGLKRLKNDLTSDVTNLNQNINNFEKKIEEISNGFQSEVNNQIKSVIETFRNDYKNDIDNIKEDVQSNIDEKIINSKNEVLSSVEEDFKEYDDKLDIVKKDITSNITSLENKHDEDVKTISDNFKGLQGKIEVLDKTSKKNTSDINVINSQISNLSDLFEFKSETEVILSEMNTGIQGIQTIVNDLQNSVQGVQNVALDELKSLREHVKEHVYSYFKEDDGIKETIDESLKGVKEEYIENVQTIIDKFKEQVEQVENFEDFEYVLDTCRQIDNIIHKLGIIKKHCNIPDSEWNEGTQGVQS